MKLIIFTKKQDQVTNILKTVLTEHKIKRIKRYDELVEYQIKCYNENITLITLFRLNLIHEQLLSEKIIRYDADIAIIL